MKSLREVPTDEERNRLDRYNSSTQFRLGGKAKKSISDPFAYPEDIQRIQTDVDKLRVNLISLNYATKVGIFNSSFYARRQYPTFATKQEEERLG